MGARIRTIKPDFWDDDKIAALSRPARLTFLGLISAMSDDEGRCRGNPRVVRAAVYPLDDDVTSGEIDSHLDELQKQGLIARYAVNGQQYIQIVNFTRHQRIQKPSPSQVPSMSAGGTVAMSDESRSSTGTVAEGRGSLPPVGDGNGMERSGDTQPTPTPAEPHVTLFSWRDPGSQAAVKDGTNPFPKLICDELYDAWMATGHTVEYGRFRKALLPLYPAAGARYPTVQLKAAIVAFNEAADAATPDTSQFWHVNKFVCDVGRWVRLGGMPIIDEGGVTERGRAAAGAA